jgi:CHAT domain-containing protein
MELKARPYSIIHIASHGFFGGTPDQNFIMTYDRRLDMNDLESLIRPRQLADHPVELIALSACQTAEGDDKSPLGLAGVVLKSGARSALGSLWPVSDQASQEIFPLFYSFLENKGQETSTKARALQMAQMTLMNKENFRHPFYWAPFILVGNWL